MGKCIFSLELLCFTLQFICAVSTPKVALVFGVTGQDGSYLAEFLLEKGYIVHGVKRRSSSFNTERINHLYVDSHNRDLRFFLHYGDLTDSSNVINLLQKIKPDEVYNLGAQSHVQVSFETPEYTANCDAIGALRILEAIRLCGLQGKTRYYQASTSELFGKVQEIPQCETTPFWPRSPYAVAKLYAYWITVNYREAYDIFAVNGILFNHESERRGETFVTKKIVDSVARMAKGSNEVLYLGNLDSKRDWGYAKDYVEAMWLMLQQEKPIDLVIATGEEHSVREFVEASFHEIGRDVVWEGVGIDEIGKDRVSGRILVKVDSRYFRPAEVTFLKGDATKAKKMLGWQPRIQFSVLVKKMVSAAIVSGKRV